MPFRLHNAPGTFQRAIDVILSSVKFKSALMYLDDIVLLSKTVKDHIVHLQQVLTLLSDKGLTCKLTKCSFLADRMDYPGHLIHPGRLEIAGQTTTGLKELKDPTSRTVLWSFLDLRNVFCRFVQNFSRVTAVLNIQLPKDDPTHFQALSISENVVE